MQNLNKFQQGMIKALLTSILGAIRVNNYRKAVAKIASLVLLTHKHGINLYQVLPASVMKLLNNFVTKIYLHAKLGSGAGIFTLLLSLGYTSAIPEEHLTAITALAK